MALIDYQALACETAGLGPPIRNVEDCLTLGMLRPMEAGEAVIDALTQHRARVAQQVAGQILAPQRDKIGGAAMALYHKHVPLSLSDYLAVAKDLPQAAKDWRALTEAESHLRAIQDQIRHHVGMGSPSQDTPSNLVEYYNSTLSVVLREVERIEGVNATKLKRKLDADVKAFHTDYPPAVIELIKAISNVRSFTPDLAGYLAYLNAHTPALHDALHQPFPLNIQERDRKQHTYIVGTTGSGKSELIKLLVHGYLNQDAAVVVIDPHGDLVEQIARWQAFQHADRLVYVDPFLFGGDLTPTLNPLHAPDVNRLGREVIADQLANAFEEFLKGSGGTSLTLNMRVMLKPCLQLLIDDKPDATLFDLQDLLIDGQGEDLVALGLRSERRFVREFFQHRYRDPSFAQSRASLANKLQSLFNSDTFTRLVCGPQSLDLEKAIDERKIILVNLSKGRIGTDASEALGRFIIAKLQGLAMRRAETGNRVPVHLFIDECHNYVDTSTEKILTEARKYGLHVTLAQQVSGQGMSSDLADIVMNNANLKFGGLTHEDNRLAKALGVPLDDMRQFATGEFACKIRNRPAFRFRAADHLIDGRNTMSESAWQTIKNQQKRYYRNDDGEADRRTPVRRERKLI